MQQVTQRTITSAQIDAVRRFSHNIKDFAMKAIVDRGDRHKIASAYNMYTACYPEFSRYVADSTLGRKTTAEIAAEVNQITKSFTPSKTKTRQTKTRRGIFARLFKA